MSESHRGAEGRERTAFWVLLALSVLGYAGETAVFLLRWRALDAGDVSGLSQAAPAGVAAGLMLAAAWVLAVVLAARLRRWGWLVASILLPVSIVAFAVVTLVEARDRRAQRARRASFEEAMARALTDQASEQPRDGR